MSKNKHRRKRSLEEIAREIQAVYEWLGDDPEIAKSLMRSADRLLHPGWTIAPLPPDIVEREADALLGYTVGPSTDLRTGAWIYGFVHRDGSSGYGVCWVGRDGRLSMTASTRDFPFEHDRETAIAYVHGIWGGIHATEPEDRDPRPGEDPEVWHSRVMDAARRMTEKLRHDIVTTCGVVHHRGTGQWWVTVERTPEMTASSFTALQPDGSPVELVAIDGPYEVEEQAVAAVDELTARGVLRHIQ
jgi:hypothetical protein